MMGDTAWRDPVRFEAAFLVLFLGWLALCAPWILMDRVVPWDSKDQFYPTLHFVSESLRSGESPFWNPYVYGGYPTISDPQSLLFSPVALGLMLIGTPSVRWFDVIELLHVLAGGMGVLWLARRFGWSPTAGLCAAAVYMFGGPVAGRMQHVPIVYAYSYFPFALVALDAMIETRRARWALGFGAVAGIMAAHQNQVAFLFSLFLLGYLLHRMLASESIVGFVASRWRSLALAACTAGAVLAVPLYATLQFLPLSNRFWLPLDTAAQNRLDPLAWTTLLVPGFLGHSGDYWGPGDLTETYLYAGALPAVLLLRYGIGRGALLDRRFLYLWVAGALALLYSLGNFTPFYSFFYEYVPGVSLYRRPTDASFVLNVVVALGTGFVMNGLLRGEMPGPRRIFRAGVIAVVGIGMAWAVVQALRQQRFDGIVGEALTATVWLICALVLLELLSRAISPRIVLIATCAALTLMALDLASHNVGQRFNAVSRASFALLDSGASGDPLAARLGRPLEPDASGGAPRVEFVRAGSLWANAPMVMSLEATQGYNPLRYRLYERAFGALESHSSARPFTSLTPGYEGRMLDLMGVRYIVSVDELAAIDPTADEGRFPRVVEGALNVWENPDPLPRVQALTQVYVDPDTERAVEGGRLPEVDFESVVVLQDWPPTLPETLYQPRSLVQLPGGGRPRVSITEYANARVRIRVETEGDVVVVLHDLYYPYWNVRVDGDPAELLRADYLFRGVHVPPGEHEVVFAFEPLSLSAVRQTVSRFLEASRTVPEGAGRGAPSVTSVDPRSGSGDRQVFEFAFQDPDGFRDLVRQTFLINRTLDTASACYLYHENGAIQLADDSGEIWQGPVEVGTDAVLENSQCRISLGGSSVSGDGEVFTVSLDLTFFAGFAGTHSIWAYTEDRTDRSAFGAVGRWALWADPPTLMDRLRFVLGIPVGLE